MMSRVESHQTGDWREPAVVGLILVAVLAGVGWAALAAHEPAYQPGAPAAWILGLALLAATLLLVAGSRVRSYIFGLTFLGTAFISFWLASPNGATLVTYAFHMPDFASGPARAFGFFALLLFPLGWMFLGNSVGTWVKGLVSYLCIGAVCVLLHSVMGGPITLATLPIFWLFWPHVSLTALGLFGWPTPAM